MMYKYHCRFYKLLPADTLVVDVERQMWALLEDKRAVLPPLQTTEEQLAAWIERQHPHWEPLDKVPSDELRERIALTMGQGA